MQKKSEFYSYNIVRWGPTHQASDDLYLRYGKSFAHSVDEGYPRPATHH